MMHSQVPSHQSHSEGFRLYPGLQSDGFSAIDSPETALWRAVIVQALEDAVGAYAGPDAALLRDADHHRRQARAWFGTRGFHQVCDMASASPHHVMQEYERRITCPA